MPSRLRRFRWKDPVVFMIGALLCAAALVIYLQQRARVALDRQTALTVQRIADQTTVDVLESLRRKFDGPVFDTLASVKHPNLAENRLDLVAPAFARGLLEYPQVERFFVWLNADGKGKARELLFFGREDAQAAMESVVGRPESLFHRDRPLSAIIKAAALRHAKTQNIYAAFTTEIGGVPRDVFTRTFFTDAARTDFYAVMGFTVNLQSVREDLFPKLLASGLGELLAPGSGGLAFDMRIHDDAGNLVFGPATALPEVFAQRPIDLAFYPVEDIGPRMAATISQRSWTLTLSPRGGPAPVLIAYTRRQTYWLSILSVLLICVALAFALQARARANQLERMQSEFVAHVSHQLKTPVSLLNAVGETIDVVRARSPEKLDQCLDIIKTETGRLSALVQHILEFSSVQDGRRSLELEPVALGPLIRETTESFAAALAPTGFRVEVEQWASPVVEADPVALEQAVVNLLDNAIKYSAESRVVTVRVSTDASYARIEVVDRGIGIDPHDRPRLFERFYRGASGSAHRQGFGLGLAIAQQLIEGHRGFIDVETTPGGGSTFRINLPRLGPAAGVTPASTAPWFAVTGASRAGRRPGKESA